MLHSFDLGARWSFDAGAGLGAVYFDQRFETAGSAPPRRSWGGLFWTNDRRMLSAARSFGLKGRSV